jgi:putative hydrolase of the HAD superfamily
MIKIISFDVDGTLVDQAFVDFVWNEGVPLLYSKQKNIPFEKAKKYVKKKYDEIGEEDIRWYLPSYWFKELGLKGKPEDLIRKYADELKVFPEVPKILEKLSKRFDLIASTNASREFIEVSLRTLKGFLKYTFSSTTDFGLVRKKPKFYARICDILGIKPHEMVHVGDHKKFDYLVPRKIGINSFLLDRSGKEEGDFVVRDLEEFYNSFLKIS